MNPTVKKWIIRPAIILAITFVVLIGVVFVILSTQQQRLVKLAVGELNQQVKGELVIEKSSISLFKNFPDISIALHKSQFFSDKTKKGKPIAQFDVLYVGFNVRELLKKNYRVRKLFLKGGYLNLIKQENGTINLLERENIPADSVATAEVQTDTAAISVQLEKIVIKEMNISFLDQTNGQKISTRIDQLTSTMALDSGQLSLEVVSDMKLDVSNKNDTALFRDKRMHLDMAAAYKFESSLFQITTCKLRLEDAGFNVIGFASLANEKPYINFYVGGEKQDFNLFSAFIPDDLKGKLKPFQYDGLVRFDAVVKGDVEEGSMPQVHVTVSCDSAWFLNTGANRKVDHISFNALYTNGSERNLKTSEIHITNFSAQPGRGIFNGHIVVRDFANPQAVVDVSSELDLKFLGEFLGIPDLKQMTGTIKLDMAYKEMDDIILPEESLNKLKEGIESRLVVENLSFKIPGYPHEVHHMNMQAEMQDGRVLIDSAYFSIGESDVELSGSVSDVRAFLRDRHKSIKMKLNVSSKQLMLSNLLEYDTALVRKWNEEVHGFNINLAFETTVQQLLNPSPLPRGTFEMKNLRGTFKNYGHTVKNLGATVIITDTLLRLRDFTGMIDSSDIAFKGRVSQYHLWFDPIKKGKTQIAFDFKSNRFALRDVFTKNVRAYLPRGYRREQLNNVWLRSKIDLKYDTSFRFAKAKVTNISADLKQHKLKLHEISGGVKYGSKILSFDTLRGKVGNSDFDINLKYYFKGTDRYNKAIANSLTFKSKLLDADEMSHYDLAPKTGKVKRDSTGKVVAIIPDSTSVHAQTFNIFMIPFSDFNAQIEIGKLKYNKLWLKDVNMKATMLKDQTITIDTLTMKVAGGAVAMRGKFNGSDHQKIYFRSRIKFDQVDLAKMLLKLDHFGQDVVINKNLKGTLSGEVKSYVQVHPDLVPIVNNSRAQLNLTIYNGSLVDFAPMQAMASYFKDKNLRLIRFDTLQNKLTFTNGVLEIPEMDINSSLGYIQLSGKQSLDLSMEYYIRVPMKMVTKIGMSSLFNKRPEEVDLNQIDQIEYIDKDKKIAFMNLKVTGTPDGNYDVGLGRQAKKKKTI
ncbi:MAG TPA: AsmA-like C-terminal region-containing protein [Cyclobacteriaceae bacterium]|nr:AsmA-like C-terminal region-containing protein [Cyclobacteriaceae bacterium]